MERQFEPDLETLLTRELRRLPPRRAPATLAPRVLAAIQTRAQTPWWRRPIWTWPQRMQWLVAALFLSALVAGWSAASIYAPLVTMADYWEGCLLTLTALRDAGEILLAALAIMLRSLGHPWLLGFLALGATLYLFCLGTGALFYRLAVKRA